MKIGILGAGNVGGALGRIWASKGHDITFGVPDPLGDRVRAAVHSRATLPSLAHNTPTLATRHPA